jgi:quercetin dioxygenase-like cupin family protein
MSDLKFAKYVLTDLRLPPHKEAKEPEYNRWAKHLLWMDNSVIKGAPFVNTAWYFRPKMDVILAHTHDFDEVIGCFGTDPQKPYELRGEVEFWLEDEQYVLRNSFLIFIPRGLKHCPMHVLKVDEPIFHLSLATVVQYTKTDT